MSQPAYQFRMEPDRKLVRVVMRGFWTNDTVKAYSAEALGVGEAMAAAGVRRNEIRALVDMRELSVQGQEQLALYEQMLRSSERQPGRIATLISSALLRRQVERVDFPNQRIFRDEDEALDWLLA